LIQQLGHGLGDPGMVVRF